MLAAPRIEALIVYTSLCVDDVKGQRVQENRGGLDDDDDEDVGQQHYSYTLRALIRLLLGAVSSQRSVRPFRFDAMTSLRPIIIP